MTDANVNYALHNHVRKRKSMKYISFAILFEDILCLTPVCQKYGNHEIHDLLRVWIWSTHSYL